MNHEQNLHRSNLRSNAINVLKVVGMFLTFNAAISQARMYREGVTDTHFENGEPISQEREASADFSALIACMASIGTAGALVGSLVEKKDY